MLAALVTEWGRAGALLVRLSHYYAPSTVRALWVLLYADDGKATAGGPRFELPLLNHLFLLKVLGTPMKWRKVRGGVQVEWVGYLIDYARFEMGITESRAKWCTTWLRDKVRERRVALGELREGLVCWSLSPGRSSTSGRSSALCSPGLRQAPGLYVHGCPPCSSS